MTQARPKNVLPAKPAVKSLDDVETALAEMAWIQREAERIRGEYEDRINALYAERDAKLTLPKSAVSFDERFLTLLAAVETFAETHRDELIGEIEGKCREFDSGSITFRKIADKLVPRAEDKTLDEVLAAFLTKHKVKPAVDELLNTQLAPEVRIGDLVSIRYSWNQSYAKAALDKRTLNAKALPLKLEAQPEQITVTVGQG